MYNVLEKLRSGAPLTAKEKTIHEHGLVSVLKTLHDELDAAVLAAYGWSDLAENMASATPEIAEVASADLLQRLVTLNAMRAVEEATGTVRWLRPAFQNPAEKSALPAQEQTNIDLGDENAPQVATSTGKIKALPWPKALPDQVRAVSTALAAAPLGLPVTTIAAQFKGTGQWKKDLLPILETLAALGRARSNGDLWHQG
jgi:hypothetical protein